MHSLDLHLVEAFWEDKHNLFFDFYKIYIFYWKEYEIWNSLKHIHQHTKLQEADLAACAKKKGDSYKKDTPHQEHQINF